ncbi:MAG: efflux RND transporter periplasmic adaptor subunit [Bacteroidota bacterium]
MAKKSSSKKVWYILGAIILVIILGLLLAKKQGWIGKVDPTEVVFANAKNVDIIERVTASGKIQPELEVKISPDVSGEIIELYIEEGDSVKKGQILLKIRPDNYESFLARASAAVSSSKAQYEQSKANIAQSEARLIKANIDYNRNKKLHDDKVISDADFDAVFSTLNIAKQDVEAAKSNAEAARFNVASSQANLKDAAENLRKTTIYAPMNGTVSKLNVELGERVVGTSQMAGTELLRIANLNNMEVRVNVNENDIVRVSVGDSVVIDVDAYATSNRKFKGLVYEVASSANGQTGSSAAAVSTDAVTEFEVKIRVLRESYRDLLVNNSKTFPLRPGMTASVEIITDRKNGVLSVPLASVTTRDLNAKPEEEKSNFGPPKENTDADKDKKVTKKEPLKEVVFVNDKGKAKLREVKTGISDFENIEILSGLKNGEEIISGPFLAVSKKLKQGDLIKKKVDKPADKKE